MSTTALPITDLLSLLRMSLSSCPSHSLIHGVPLRRRHLPPSFPSMLRLLRTSIPSPVTHSKRRHLRTFTRSQCINSSLGVLHRMSALCPDHLRKVVTSASWVATWSGIAQSDRHTRQLGEFSRTLSRTVSITLTGLRLNVTLVECEQQST